MSNQRLLFLGFWVAILSVVGGLAISIVWGAWSDPPAGGPTTGMPPGPVYLRDLSFTGAFQNGGIVIKKIAFGEHGIGTQDLTGPSAYFGNGVDGTVIESGLITTDDGLQIKSSSGRDIFTKITAGDQTENINYTLPSAQGGVGTYLANDGLGNLSWHATSTLLGVCAAGEILKYNGSNWVCGSDNVGGGGTAGVTSLTANPGISVSAGTGAVTVGLAGITTACTTGQVLKWTSTGVLECGEDYAGSSGPTYTAGTGIDINSSNVISLTTTEVAVGSYTNANITVDAQGRITSASNGSSSGLFRGSRNGEILRWSQNLNSWVTSTAINVGDDPEVGYNMITIGQKINSGTRGEDIFEEIPLLIRASQTVFTHVAKFFDNLLIGTSLMDKVLRINSLDEYGTNTGLDSSAILSSGQGGLTIGHGATASVAATTNKLCLNGTCITSLAPVGSNPYHTECLPGNVCRMVPGPGVNGCSADLDCGATPPTGENTCGGSPCRLVFVTDEQWTGDLGGLEGADAKCQTAATNGGLYGTYKAWLSSSYIGPASRFDRNPAREGIPYYRTNHTDKIADNFLDLLDGSLNNAVEFNEFGILTADHGSTQRVWTGTLINGNPRLPDNCINWTKGITPSPNPKGGYGLGYLGTSAGWTNYSTNGCAGSLHLYCFQQ